MWKGHSQRKEYDVMKKNL